MVPNPFQTADLMVRTATMLAQANMVVAMRLWGMAGLWNVTKSENGRMFSEKTAAMRDASRAVTTAMMAGATPLAVASAALAPVSRRTASNVRRLSRRGPFKT